MKKTTIAAFLFALLALLSACAGQEKPSESAVSTPEGSASITYPAFSFYSEYFYRKNAAIEDIIDCIVSSVDETNAIPDAITLVGRNEIPMMPISHLDSSEYSKELLKQLEITDVAVIQDKDTYKLTYNREGSAWELNCIYDEQAGSLQISTVCGEEKIFFQMRKEGNGYVSQYYIKDDATLARLYIDDKITSFGVQTAQDKPESILDGRTLTADFTDNDELNLILKDGKLTADINGEVRTMTADY